MTIDASIYERIQPIQIESPINALAKVEQLRGTQNQNRLFDMQVADRESARVSQNALSDAYRKAYRPDGSLDEQGLISNLAQSGQGGKIAGIQEGFAKTAKAKAEATKFQLDNSLKTLDVVSQSLGPTLQNPTMYPQVRAALMQQYPEGAANLPEQFDPAAITAVINKTLTAKDQISIKQKEIDQMLDREKFGETKRNNQVQNGIAGGNLSLRRQELEQKKQGGGGKPLPASALKMQQGELDAIGTASAIQSDIGALEKQINDGKLKFGGVRNLMNTGKNMAGISDEESRNFSTFKSSLERLRNDSLRLNNGVQTDGDAQRAWNELFESINDTALVKQRLAEIKKINERAVNIRKMNVDSIRSNFGAEPIDTSGYQNQPAAVGAGRDGTATVKTADDYNKLPSGATYVDPNGNTRRKP